ncbi:hypothetical protein SELMODRAFT_133094 [Selaginella moellendorffii]|uniref:Pentacotripeptide-repeat region of PRORP domain-containing protein n=2 Tax=Selaginella moellendorffii TaxID=88036 RepID=D8T6F8_SELML|nr:hypothetical protein SELMODRAFT_133094 [Selaginella moellendorffii]
MPARDLASGNGLVSGYARLGQWESARAAFWALPERDVVSWNTMIAACVERDRPQESLALFREMDLDGVAPNRITLASILSACDGSQENIAHALIAGLRDLEPDAMIGTALVILYGRCGSCEKSLEIFHQMEEPRDPGAWNSIIAALARNGHTDAAIAMLRRLECEGIEPDFAVFNSILFACSHGGSLREGYAHFLIMGGDYGIAASASHFMCLIDLLGRAGKLEAAEELIDSMPFEADGLAWTILLSSCKSHNDVERGAMAAMRVAEFESWQSSTYVMLSSIMRN